MKLKKLIINGFRSFGKKTIIEFSDENVLIGNNGAGKTSCLLALNKMFSQNPSDRIFRKNDFYVQDGENDSKKLMIETIFELDNLLEDSEQYAEKEYWAKLLVKSNETSPILRIRLNAEWSSMGATEGTVDSEYSFVLSPEGTDVDEEKTQLAKRSELSSFRFIYIPATRNPEKQLGNASESLITRLIKRIQWSDMGRDELKELGKKIDEAFWNEEGALTIQDSIKKEWSELAPDDRYSQVSATLSSVDLERLIKQVQFNFESTITHDSYSVSEMSDGIKSLFYISNIASLLDIEQKVGDGNIIDIDKPVVTMFAIEEPENHVSPHLLGRLMGKLKEIADSVNTQVFITSHSPSIVKRIDPEHVLYVHLTNDGTEIEGLELPSKTAEAFEFVKRAIQLYPELYFSKLVIIGEGDSEEIVLSKIFNNYTGLDRAEVSVVPLGGRYVKYIWRLLEKLNIPYITLLDLDMERYQGGNKRIEYILNNLEEYRGTDKKISNLRNELSNVKNRDKLLEIVNKLEEFDVFLSSPLDLDFMMLSSFFEEYRSNLKRKPRKKTNEEILNRTLKGKSGSGDMYSNEEIELMLYYNSLFLNIGKPAIHIETLEKIDNEKLRDNLPGTLMRLVKCAEKKISNKESRSED